MVRKRGVAKQNWEGEFMWMTIKTDLLIYEIDNLLKLKLCLDGGKERRGI